MKIAKMEAKATIATAIVMLLLGSGAVFAFSTRAQYSSNHFNAPQPLAGDTTTSTTTTSSTHSEHGQEHSETTHTSTSQHGEDEDPAQEEVCTTSTSTSTATTTSTSTSTSTTTENKENEENEAGECGPAEHQVQEEHELKFRIVPATSDSTGQGEANIQIRGTTLRVDIEVEHAKASTTYLVVLVSLSGSTTTTSASTTTFSTTTTTTSTPAGCSTHIGSFVTSEKGNGHAELETTLSAGNYLIGLVLCSDSKALLVSDPATRSATITQSTAGQSETENQQGENVQEHTANENDEKDIKGASDGGQIPGVVQVSDSSASVTKVDPKFSISVGKTSNNGLIVSISADNVTGSRVLLVNLTGSSYTTDSLKTLRVTYDGKTISQASSLSQILRATPSDPARFIVLVTSAGVQLLVSIPHFSSHVIQIFSGLARAGSFLAINLPILIGGVLVVSMLFAALYAKRRRFYNLFF